jgi:predicted AlkP superfamily pyrophosphatase or phosphodiesterase
MNSRALLFLSVLFAVGFGSCSKSDNKDHHVILISIDGWAHQYFDDPKCHMPAVKALAAKGVRAKRMECSFPTVTWTNHTTLVTGVHPAKHGVLANEYFDRAERKRVPLIPDPLFNKEEIVICEKSLQGRTRVFSLMDVKMGRKVRRDENHYRKYLSGAYGGVPLIG